MSRNDNAGLPAANPAHAWAVLHEHPALMWIPPLWRTEHQSADNDIFLSRHAVRAIERNLVIDVQPAAGGGCTVRLATGPLHDRQLGDGVDPVAPAATHDSRLDVSAATFESALCALAERVTDVYGPATTTAAPPTWASCHGDSGQATTPTVGCASRVSN